MTDWLSEIEEELLEPVYPHGQKFSYVAPQEYTVKMRRMARVLREVIYFTRYLENDGWGTMEESIDNFIWTGGTLSDDAKALCVAST